VRGRKKIPTALKLIKGTARKHRTNFKEPKISVEAPKPPSHLGKIAKEEWKRKIPVLLQMGIISLGDDAALAAYCMAYERWVTAEKALQKKKETLTLSTLTGNIIQNPLVGVANRAMELMHKFLIEFGLTPVSRTRIKVDNIPPNKKESRWQKLTKITQK